MLFGAPLFIYRKKRRGGTERSREQQAASTFVLALEILFRLTTRGYIYEGRREQRTTRTGGAKESSKQKTVFVCFGARPFSSYRKRGKEGERMRERQKKQTKKPLLCKLWRPFSRYCTKRTGRIGEQSIPGTEEVFFFCFGAAAAAEEEE